MFNIILLCCIFRINIKIYKTISLNTIHSKILKPGVRDKAVYDTKDLNNYIKYESYDELYKEIPKFAQECKIKLLEKAIKAKFAFDENFNNINFKSRI